MLFVFNLISFAPYIQCTLSGVVMDKVEYQQSIKSLGSDVNKAKKIGLRSVFVLVSSLVATVITAFVFPVLSPIFGAFAIGGLSFAIKTHCDSKTLNARIIQIKSDYETNKNK